MSPFFKLIPTRNYDKSPLYFGSDFERLEKVLSTISSIAPSFLALLLVFPFKTLNPLKQDTIKEVSYIICFVLNKNQDLGSVLPGAVARLKSSSVEQSDFFSPASSPGLSTFGTQDLSCLSEPYSFDSKVIETYYAYCEPRPV